MTNDAPNGTAYDQIARGLALFAVLVAFVGSITVFRSQQITCQRVESQKAKNQQTLIRSLDSLGRPGSAGYEYYRQHPQELAVARTNARKEIKFYAPSSCGLF